jgi:para-nitrobenzyl esterase
MRDNGAQARVPSRARLAAAAIAVGALLAGLTAAAASAGPASAGPAARTGPIALTRDGAVRGLITGNTSEFLGIPYAAPPVGALRWRPPRPAVPWAGVRDATSFGPHCPQSASPFGEASTSENCLFLNVFAPAGGAPAGGAPAGRPVLVWIHGGALVSGESDDYDPTALVGHGVIVVSINYRLGALGFLADSALANRAGDAGNYGLADQQAALRWVRANIAGFGGDPRNVTIFGESAGGLSVLSQLDSRGARGLFQRAIVESGSYNLTQTSRTDAETAGAAFAAKVGCTQAVPAQVAACLRGVPVSTILADENTAGYTPDLDGKVLTQSVGTALASGQFNRVPVIMGTNHDEWRLFVALDQLAGEPAVTAANYEAQISATLGVPATVAAVIAEQYPLAGFASPPVALGAVGTDAIFACPSLAAVSSLSRFVPTFAYEFNDENAPERFLPGVGFPYGAAHASELQYLFGLSAAPIPATLTPAQQQLAAQMQGYWTSQARRGDPATPGQPAWPRFNVRTQQVLSLDEPRPTVETSFSAEHHCGFWAALGAQAGQ